MQARGLFLPPARPALHRRTSRCDLLGFVVCVGFFTVLLSVHSLPVQATVSPSHDSNRGGSNIAGVPPDKIRSDMLDKGTIRSPDSLFSNHSVVNRTISRVGPVTKRWVPRSRGYVAHDYPQWHSVPQWEESWYPGSVMSPWIPMAVTSFRTSA